MKEQASTTIALLGEHLKTYPLLQAEDVFKFLFQSAMGCEHLVANESAVLDYLTREYETLLPAAQPLTEPLDGAYSRVHLSCLSDGLKPKTLARLFCLSARKEPDGARLLEEKLADAARMVAQGELPIARQDFDEKLAKWRDAGYPAVRHSETFRTAYHPAYRVVSNRYAAFLPLFAEIDKRSDKAFLTVAIEGGSASGKSTLADMLQEVYDCNVFHMDDFFLRPEQRTPERLAEPGGNVDRERFCEEILLPLKKNEAVRYRRFDCATESLSAPIDVLPKRLTVVEGAYSMHPALADAYDLTVFLDIDSAYQKKRITLRNSPQFARRFFEEWIPLEQVYFEDARVRERADLVLPIREGRC